MASTLAFTNALNRLAQKGGRPDMSATLAEKLLQRHSDTEVTGPRPDRPVPPLPGPGHDITAPLAIKAFGQMGAAAVFDRDKVVIVADHFTPNKDNRLGRTGEALPRIRQGTGAHPLL